MAYRNGNGNGRNGGRAALGSEEPGSRGGPTRMPTIGEQTDETSYPMEDCGVIGKANLSLGVGTFNYNAANFVHDPEVFNESPADKKDYAWNRGEEGNANG